MDAPRAGRNGPGALGSGRLRSAGSGRCAGGRRGPGAEGAPGAAGMPGAPGMPGMEGTSGSFSPHSGHSLRSSAHSAPHFGHLLVMETAAGLKHMAHS